MARNNAYNSYSSHNSSTGTRGAPRPPNPEGMRVLDDLLRRPPAQIAEWALDQAQELGKAGVNVEQLPLFQLAGALNGAPSESKQALVQRAVEGFGDLPPRRRAEAVRLAMRSADIVQKADILEVAQLAQQHHAAAMQRLRALEEQQAKSQGGVVDASSPGNLPGGGGAHDDLALPAQDPMVENLLKITKEARFNEMPPQELQSMAKAAQGQAHKLMQPQQLLDVVAELKPEEREQLTEALVEAQVVPEEQRGVLEEAVRPGGYADKLASALAVAATVQQYAWVFVALPIVEFVLSLIFGSMSCNTPLVAWLRFDSLLALCVAGAAYFTGHTLAPVYQKLKEDPMGAVQRWQSVQDVRSWKTRLETAVPGVDFDTYRAGAAGLAASVVLILIGAVWAVIGVLELLATMVFQCAFVTTFFCIIFIGMRFACVVAMLWGLYYVLDEVQRHRSRAPMLGSSLLPMSEDALPRGQAPQNMSGFSQPGYYNHQQNYNRVS